MWTPNSQNALDFLLITYRIASSAASCTFPSYYCLLACPYAHPINTQKADNTLVQKGRKKRPFWLTQNMRAGSISRSSSPSIVCGIKFLDNPVNQVVARSFATLRNTYALHSHIGLDIANVHMVRIISQNSTITYSRHAPLHPFKKQLRRFCEHLIFLPDKI